MAFKKETLFRKLLSTNDKKAFSLFFGAYANGPQALAKAAVMQFGCRR